MSYTNQMMSLEERKAKEKIIEEVASIFEEIDTLLQRRIRKVRRLKIWLFGLGSITTGALWFHLGGMYPEITQWVGVICSTSVSIISSYLLRFKIEESTIDLFSALNNVSKTLKSMRDRLEKNS